MKNSHTGNLLTLAFGLLICTTANATMIGAGGGGLVQSWGKDNTQTYGQTITTPTDNVLDSFSFWLGRTSTNYPDPSNPSLSFKAYVYAWDDVLSQATGPAIYTSGIYTHNATPDTPFTEYTFNTGGLSLNSGDMYALFLSASGLAGTGRIMWEAATSDEYLDGNFIYMNNGENTDEFTTTAWGSGYASDLHFTANFSSVPEPASIALIGVGLISLAFTRRGKDAVRNRIDS